ERELEKLNKSIGGIKDLTKLPDALFVIDVGYHKIAVAEARTLGIPVVAVVDTNQAPAGIEQVTPGNEHPGGASALLARGIGEAVLEGREQALSGLVEELSEGAKDDEFVEVPADNEQASE